MNAELIESYRKNGYVRVPGAVDKALTRALRLEIHSVFKYRMRALGYSFGETDEEFIETKALFDFYRAYRQDYVGCMQAVQNLATPYGIGASAQMRGLATSLGVGHPGFSTKPIIMMSSEYTSASNAYWKTPPHQDWRSIQGSLNCIVVWVSLADTTPERGPVEVIPGSHVWGLLETEPDEWYRRIVDPRVRDDAFVAAPVEEGDALAFSAFLVHRSGTNRSQDFRYSLQFRFNDYQEESFADRGFPSPYASDRPVEDFVRGGYAPDPAHILRSLGIGKH